LNAEKVWKQDVPTEDEEDLLTQVFHQMLIKGYAVGRWRPVYVVLEDRKTGRPFAKIGDIPKIDKEPGLLARVHKKWNLYFYKDPEITIHTFMAALKKHPLVAVGTLVQEPDKLIWVLDPHTSRWCQCDHLSPFDFGFRCRRNFGVRGGYTKEGDGAPLPETGKQITHFWMEITSGRGEERNSQIIANMLCEIAGFDLPYPEIFSQEGLGGEIASGSASAVGDAESGPEAGPEAGAGGEAPRPPPPPRSLEPWWQVPSGPPPLPARPDSESAVGDAASSMFGCEKPRPLPPTPPQDPVCQVPPKPARPVPELPEQRAQTPPPPEAPRPETPPPTSLPLESLEPPQSAVGDAQAPPPGLDASPSPRPPPPPWSAPQELAEPREPQLLQAPPPLLAEPGEPRQPLQQPQQAVGDQPQRAFGDLPRPEDLGQQPLQLPRCLDLAAAEQAAIEPTYAAWLRFADAEERINLSAPSSHSSYSPYIFSTDGQRLLALGEAAPPQEEAAPPQEEGAPPEEAAAPAATVPAAAAPAAAALTAAAPTAAAPTAAVPAVAAPLDSAVIPEESDEDYSAEEDFDGLCSKKKDPESLAHTRRLPPVRSMPPPGVAAPAAPAAEREPRQPVAPSQTTPLDLWPMFSPDDFPAIQDTSNFVALGGPDDANVNVEPSDVAVDYRREVQRYHQMLRTLKRFNININININIVLILILLNRVNPPDQKRTNLQRDRPQDKEERRQRTKADQFYKLAVDLNLCMWAKFPDAALDRHRDGYYANKYASVLRDLAVAQGLQKAASGANPHLLQRTRQDGILVRKLMRLFQPADQLNALEENVQADHEFDRWTHAWRACMESKPDLDYFGFVGLSDEKFRAKFNNETSTFLNHMFEKHDGEIIVVDMWKSDKDARHPGTMALHHEQFYVGTGEESGKAKESARFAWTGAKVDEEKCLDTFLLNHGHVRTVVFQPSRADSVAFYRQTDRLETVSVGYFSLPSWVFEMFKYGSLCDLYTLFCAAPLLAGRARHSRVENARRDGGRLNFKETGRWGHH